MLCTTHIKSCTENYANNYREGKMKIVEIDDFVHPSTGYQVNVLSKYFVKFGHDVTIVCGEMEKMPSFLTDFFDISNIEEDDRKFREETGVKIIRMPIKNYISGRAIYTSEIFRTVDRLEPDILFIHSEDTMIAMQFMMRMRNKKYALIMDNHQCDISSRNRFREFFRFGFRRVFTPIIKRNEYKVVRLEEENFYMQDHYNIPIELTPLITFGSDTMLFHPDESIREKFRKDNDISEDAFVVVYAGKLDEYKGGQFLADTIQKKFTTSKEIVFVIVGNTSGEYGEKVEKTFSQSENRILRFPTQKYAELAPFFQVADLAIFPKECSLSFYDVQACGLPVVSEDNEINLGRCSNHNGLNFRSGDIEDFREKITKMTEMDKDEFKSMSESAKEFVLKNYNYEDKARQFEKLMLEEIERQKEC